MTLHSIQPEVSYLQLRLQQLGITEDQNTFLRTWIQPSSDKDENGKVTTENKLYSREYKFFDSDDDGNIVIHYFNLIGQPYRWKKDNTAQVRDFIRTRLHDPNAPFKYFQEKGSPQFPFFNPNIIAKYKKCKEGINIDGSAIAPIETLFVVEGEFKSFKGYLCGLDIIGLPSIHGFYDGDVKGKLHEDIQELIITCCVKKIVFLVDADLLTLKWEAEKDLYKRPASFYGAVKAFRESLQLLLDNDKVSLELPYFMHLDAKFNNDAKGLDDLLSKYEAKKDDIIKDLLELNFANKYFHGIQILDQSKDVQGKVQKYLGLFDEQEFYKTYQEFIGVREFRFKRRRYVYDSEKKEVVYVRHDDADKFMRIGADWVKVIKKKNKHGELEEEIVPWKISEIQRDYKRYPDFLDQVQKYDDFCNEPCFSSEYKRIHDNNYNLCNPLTSAPVPGGIHKSISFLKHVFQGTSKVNLDDIGNPISEEFSIGDTFAVAIDYLSILIQHPKHMLPVPILVSKENGTGKTTFLRLLQAIFGMNIAILGNEHFKMKFNAHYITKFIIAIDEGFLEVEKKSEKERLKQLVTADSAYLEYKGMNIRKLNYYGKIIICSNDADRIMKIDEGESRWFVIKVPVIPKDQKDPGLEAKIKNEVPALLHYLSTRQIFHPQKDRLWFEPEWFITDQFKIIVSETKNRIDRVLEEWLRDQFMLYGQDTLEYPLKYITEQMNDAKISKYKVDNLEIKTYLKSKGLFPADRVKWMSIPVGFKNEGSITIENSVADLSSKEIDWRGFPGRPYTFRKSDWANEILFENFVRKSIEDNYQENIESRPIEDLPF